MKIIALFTLALTTFVTTSAFAGPIFSARLKGRQVPGILTIPVRDRALFNHARATVQTSVVLSNRTNLIVRLKLPATVVTTQHELEFTGDIVNNTAKMRGPLGNMLCRAFEQDVLCRFEIVRQPLNLRVLEAQLRLRRAPELFIKNQLDVARFFSAQPKGYVRFNRSTAGLHFSR